MHELYNNIHYFSYLLLFSNTTLIGCGVHAPKFYHVENCPSWAEAEIFEAEKTLEKALDSNLFTASKDLGISIRCRELPDFKENRRCKTLSGEMIACAVYDKYIEINLDLYKHYTARRSIVLHEFGHLLGILDHSPYPEDVMFHAYDKKEDEKELTFNDIFMMKTAMKERE